MKKSLFWIIYLCLINDCFPQKANMFIRDLINNSLDTIRFGYDENSTIGIDSVLGEKNIRNDSLKSLDFRILQRDSIDFYCLNPFGYRIENGDIVYDSVYYSPSFDSKVNYRPKDSTNRHFEILMHYENDVRYKIECTSKMKYFLDKIILYVLSCPHSKPIVATAADPNIGESETLLFNAFDTGYHLILVFKDSFELPTKSRDLFDTENIKLNIYPNPFKDIIFMDINGNLEQIEIFDVNGKVLFKDFSIEGSNHYLLHTKEWLSGLYFVTAWNKKGDRIIRKINKI